MTGEKIRERALYCCYDSSAKLIVLIDEYDVPLAKANENGYYDEMILLIRNLFENGLK